MPILVTGAAGFIGSHVAAALLDRGEEVLGVDSLNTYYSPALKQARLDRLLPRAGFRFQQLDISDQKAVAALASPDIDRIIHLAAQAGVRHSITAPFDYAAANLVGHLAILELARNLPALRHLVSSSSVYGANTKMPFAETDRVDTPLSLYAATKRADELMSHAYAHLYRIPQTGLRFFTVYGPWGRPDMAYYSFAEAIMRGDPITLYDRGRLKRDFTYIDDIVAGILGCLDHPPAQEAPPIRVLNIGNHQAETVATLIGLLEAALGKKAIIRDVPRPATEVTETFADIDAIASLTGFAPTTPLSRGIPRFAAWFKNFRAI